MGNSCSFVSAHYAFQHQFIEDGVQFYYRTEETCYISFFALSDTQTLHYKLEQKWYALPAGHQVIHYLEKYETLEIACKERNGRVLVVVIAPDSFAFFHKKYQQEPARFTQGYRTKGDARFNLLLEQLHSLSKSHLLYKMRSELIILEIICHQIASLAVKTGTIQKVSTKDHYEKVLLAKEIIERDLSENHSIPELAKQVGTNVQYLKRYFKQYFGKTIGNYVTEKKMEYAKELILTGNHRISDVARMTGYKYSTHFTAAFKKHFGFIPNALKYSLIFCLGTDLLNVWERTAVLL